MGIWHLENDKKAAEIEQLRAELESAKQRVQELFERSHETLQPNPKEIEDLKVAIDAVAKERDKYKSLVTSNEVRIKKIVDEKLHRELERAETKIHELLDSIEQKEIGVARLRVEHAELLAENEQLRAEPEAANSEIERLKSAHENCGIAIVMLSRALREALSGVNKYTQQMERLQAVLKEWGVAK